MTPLVTTPIIDIGSSKFFTVSYKKLLRARAICERRYELCCHKLLSQKGDSLVSPVA